MSHIHVPGHLQLTLNDWFYVVQLHDDNLDVRIQQQIFGEQLTAISAQLWTAWKKQFSFPLTWWDAIKLSFFPGWLLERCGAKIKTYSFAEVIPMLSKDQKVAEGQLRKNTIGSFKSVVRRPIENYSSFPLYKEA